MNCSRDIAPCRLLRGVVKSLLLLGGLSMSVMPSAMAATPDSRQIRDAAPTRDSAQPTVAAREENSAAEATAGAQLAGKLTPQAAAAYMFSSFYVKNTDGISDACAQQGISVSSFTRRFIELHAS